MQEDSIQPTDIAIIQKETTIRLVRRTEERLRTQVGYNPNRRRRKRIPIQPVVAAEILQREDFLIDFNPQSKEVKEEGVKSIWQYLAFRNPLNESYRFLDKPTTLQRCDSVRAHDRMIRRAFVAFRRHYDNDHKDRPLLMLPRTVASQDIEIITFDPDLAINGDGQTAADVYVAVNEKRCKENVRTFMEKLGVIGGEERVRNAKDFIMKFIQDEVINGCRQPMLTFNDNNE